MVSIFKRPPALILSQSDAWFQITNTGDKKKVIATIWVAGSEIGKAHAFASCDNTAHFELSDFFKPSVLPEYSGAYNAALAMTAIASKVRRTFNITFECTNESVCSVSETISVLYGAITPDLARVSNYGSPPFVTTHDYLSAYPFLTIRPPVINLHYPGQPEKLNFLSPVATGSISVSLQVLHSDGTGYSVSMGSFTPAANTMYEFDASYTNTVEPRLQGGNEKNPVTIYKFIFSTGNSGAAKEFTYRAKFSDKPTGSFLFVNSLGGRDTFCPTGSLEILSDISSSFQKTLTPPNTKQDQHILSSHSPGHTFSHNTGFLSYENMIWLSQLLYSKKVTWVNTKNIHTPVSIVSSKINATDMKAKLYNAEIKYMVNPNYKAEQQ